MARSDGEVVVASGLVDGDVGVRVDAAGQHRAGSAQVGQRVLVVAHQVVVLCLRYVLESMDEAQILAVDRAGDVANCSVTEYDFPADDMGQHKPRLIRYNFVAPVEAETVVTAAPDEAVAAG